MNWAFIDNAIAAIKELGTGIVNLIGKSKLDVTEKERLAAQVQMYGMDFQIKLMQLKSDLQMKWLELTATATWRSVLIYGSGALIGIMMLNNYVLLPYFPSLKPTPIPWELWVIFGGLIGVDMTEAYRGNKKPANPDSQVAKKTGG